MDSSVVRIEPRRPAVNVNFLEWDGLIRLCFSRKNKTLGAIFRQASTLGLMHSNYQLCQALAASGAGSSAKVATGGLSVTGKSSIPTIIPAEMDMDVEEDVNMSEEDGEDDVMDVDGVEEGSKKKVCFRSMH